MRYTLGFLDMDQVAKRVLNWYRGRTEKELREEITDWFSERVRGHIGHAARSTVLAHRSSGDLVAIASGATRYACEPVALELGIEHIVCTELEVDEGRLTGNALPPLCYGPGKLARANAFLATHGKKIEDATVYSDSITDLPILSAAGMPVVVNPDPRLKRHAERHGWRQEVW